MGSDVPCDVSHDGCMGFVLRRWRHKYSPAARRGREAARKHAARVEYTAWVAEQRRALTQHTDAAPAETQ
jgi:hypothetical protein